MAPRVDSYTVTESGVMVTQQPSSCLLQTTDIYGSEQVKRRKKPIDDDLFFFDGAATAEMSGDSDTKSLGERGRSRKPNRQGGSGKGLPAASTIRAVAAAVPVRNCSTTQSFEFNKRATEIVFNLGRTTR